MKCTINYYAEKNQPKNNRCCGNNLDINSAFKYLSQHRDYDSATMGRVKYVVEEQNKGE